MNIMKTRATAIFSALTLIAILATAASTLAQSNYRMKIAVPFDFAIGDKSYSSGRYTVGLSSNLTLIRVQSEDENKTAFITSTVPLKTQGEHQAQLEFTRYGDRYFLHRVWLGSEGHQLPKSKLERELVENSEDGEQLQAETVIITPN